MDFALLGPLAVHRDGEEVALGGPKQRAVLAILLLSGEAGASRDRLIEGVWGEAPPPSAPHTLDNYLSRLRKLLGDGRVARRAHGYAIEVRSGELDLQRFEELLARGREHLAADDAEQAAAELRAALALWRGPALADLRYEPFAQIETERLEERRLQALEDRIEADLALGESRELAPELEALVREHPFRERLLGALMLALYRAGRQSEALAAYQAGRRRLAEELGLEPGSQLQALERRILEHDPQLQPVATSARAQAEAPTRSRRRLIAATAVVLAAALVLAGVVLRANDGRDSAEASAADGLVGIDSNGHVTSRVALPDAPAAVVAGFGSLWLALPGEGNLVRVDLAKESVVDSVPVGGSPALLAVGGGSVWAASALGDRVMRVDPRTGTVAQTVPLGGARAAALAFGEGRLWVADASGDSLLEVDPHDGELRRSLPLSVDPTALAVGGGALWVADYGGASVVQVNPRSGATVASVHVGGGPASLAVAPDAVWVANALDSTVSRINPVSASVEATIPVGSGPAAVTIRDGAVWVANQYAGTVSRIDPQRNALVATARVGEGPNALAPASGRTWAALRPAAHHRGGTLVLLHNRLLDIDPALNVDVLPLQSDNLTHDGLLTYRHVPGAAGAQLVPDLAVNLPEPTDGGRTYTFRLRAGIRYSDGRPLRAADVGRGIQRTLRLRGDSGIAFAGLIGAEGCPRTCDLSRGVVADEEARTVTFHLRSADPDLPSALALSAASAIPAGTPDGPAGSKPIPGTGPYKIERASNREVRYVRNPDFHEWSHAAQPDGKPDAIVMRFGLSGDEGLDAIERNQADEGSDSASPARLPELRRRYPSRLHAFTIPTTDFAQFKTTIPPFDDVRVRRALNLAVDRHRIAQMYGGADVATPTCQILPPGIPGHRSYCPYRGPDLARARRLVAASGTRGQRVVVWGWTDDPTISPAVERYVASVLRRLGYHASTHLVPHDALRRAPERAFRHIQLIFSAWGDTPSGFFGNWFACSGSTNQGFYCDPKLDRLMRRAQVLKATRPREAATLWERLDRTLTDRAAWLPMINEHALDFVSERIRNYQVHPYWGVIVDQLWLR